jgi:meso-butanediol dehydrogenase / (S,S)-butanediol dehydrogenase / diacetyl reductase
MGILDDKVVLVTGSGGGIGEAIALHLLDEGATVIATARSGSGVDSLNKQVSRDIADRFVGRTLDVTDEGAVAGAIEETVAKFGRLDGIVNNAGVLLPNTTEAATSDEYDKTFDVNVKGVFLGCKYAIPAMLANGGGSIVNFGSINSLAAEKQLALYTASKGAVLMLTKAVALDHGGDGIRANCVCPGFVDTPLNVPHYSRFGTKSDLEEGLPDFQPIGRAILPLEIAQSVSFLLSDRSSAVTGTAFVVDGGVLSKA